MPVVHREEIRRCRRRRRRILQRLIFLHFQKRRHNCVNKQWQVRPIFRSRLADGNYYNLIPTMRLEDVPSFSNYFRMTPDTFDEILGLIKPYIHKDSLHSNGNAVPPGLKLALTLRYLASGDSMISMSFAERLGKSTVSTLIFETCEGIWQGLHERALPPLNEEAFTRIANEYFTKWNFPNCTGSIDGKHVVIQAPAKAGSTYFNYKKDHSLVLMACCDANYCFTCVDIGAQGRHNDGKTFANWDFGQAILNETLPLPPPIRLFGYTLPPVFTVDEAFPLKVNMLRPFPHKNLLPQKRILNYRLSRARRIIENTFGILAARWRIFRKPILASLKTTDNIIKATICLHNLLQRISNSKRIQGPNVYCPAALVDHEDANGFYEGRWRDTQMDGLQPMVNQGANNYTRNAASVREEYMKYFWNEGRVPWQDRVIDG